MRRNVDYNDLGPTSAQPAGLTKDSEPWEGRVRVREGDACTLMYDHRVNQVNCVDLDPYGTAAPFLDAALQATADGGEFPPVSGSSSSASADNSRTFAVQDCSPLPAPTWLSPLVTTIPRSGQFGHPPPASCSSPNLTSRFSLPASPTMLGYRVGRRTRMRL